MTTEYAEYTEGENEEHAFMEELKYWAAVDAKAKAQAKAKEAKKLAIKSKSLTEGKMRK